MEPSKDFFPIAFTGSTGSIGSQMPKGPWPLKTRLEASVEERLDEIKKLPSIPKAIIHLAALTVVGECESNPDKAYELNVKGAVKWYQAAVKSECPRFIFASTCHVYGPAKNNEKLTIDSAIDPKSAYARSKWLAETELRTLALSHLSTSLSVARIFSVLSPLRRSGFLLTTLHERAQKKDYSPIKGLSNIRDFMESKDICLELIRLAQSNEMPKLVNICSGKGTKVREIAERVFKEYDLDITQLKEAADTNPSIPYIVGVPSEF